MWKLVENNEIVKTFNRPVPLTIGDIQYPSNIFTVWTKEQLENIGIYEVVFDDTNKRDNKFFINTNQQFKFENNTVTAFYDVGFDKALEDKTELDGSITKGLKSKEIENIKNEAINLLTDTDFHIIKKMEVPSYTIPVEVTDYRASVRLKSNDMETAINNANDNASFKTLFDHTTDVNGVQSRPLGNFPKRNN